MERGEAIAAAVGAVQQRWGPHSLTRGWPEVHRLAGQDRAGRPPWWPREGGDGSLLALPRPAVLELVGPPSCGKLSLALLWLAAADQSGLIAVLDETGRFYPPSAAACGLDLERLVVVRPPSPRAAREAAALLLGSEGFDAVLWPIGPKTRLHGPTAARLAHLASRSRTTLLTLIPLVGAGQAPPSAGAGQALPLQTTPLGDIRLGFVEWEWVWADGVLAGARQRVRAERLRGRLPGPDWELVLKRSLGRSDGEQAGHLRLDAAFPIGGGSARAPGAERAPDRDLPAERALAGAG